jgi:hypothetical protein
VSAGTSAPWLAKAAKRPEPATLHDPDGPVESAPAAVTLTRTVSHVLAMRRKTSESLFRSAPLASRFVAELS